MRKPPEWSDDGLKSSFGIALLVHGFLLALLGLWPEKAPKEKLLNTHRVRIIQAESKKPESKTPPRPKPKPLLKAPKKTPVAAKPILSTKPVPPQTIKTPTALPRSSRAAKSEKATSYPTASSAALASSQRVLEPPTRSENGPKTNRPPHQAKVEVARPPEQSETNRSREPEPSALPATTEPDRGKVLSKPVTAESKDGKVPSPGRDAEESETGKKSPSSASGQGNSTDSSSKGSQEMSSDSASSESSQKAVSSSSGEPRGKAKHDSASAGKEPAPPAPAKPSETSGPTSGPRAVGEGLPDYPEDSRRKEQQGTVRVAVLVDTEGRATEVKIETSAGFPQLDQAALEYAQKMRFEPALVKGKKTRSWVVLPVHFRL